jgi:hypothetical protein
MMCGFKSKWVVLDGGSTIHEWELVATSANKSLSDVVNSTFQALKGNLYYIGMGRQSKIIKCLIFFLTNTSLGTSNSTIKSIRKILLTSVTLFEMHHFLPIKILIFLKFNFKN